MKKIKKILCLALAMVMVLAMNVTVFADTHKPVSTDTATITVKNVESGATVTAYKYVEAEYGSYGLLGYKLVDGLTSSDVADIYNVTLAEAVALTDKKLEAVTLHELKNGDYAATVAAGSYVILVKGVSEKIYNPMIVSVSYDKEGNGANSELLEGAVSANDNWVLADQTTIAKSSTPTIDKVIVGEPDVAIGDVVEFEITTVIPQYSEDYEAVTFTVVDTLSAGLTYNEDAEVSLEGAEITVDGQVVTFDFSAVALANIGKEVKISYTATVNGDAVFNHDANENTVDLIYSNDPDSDSTGRTTDKTYTYTFKIENLINKVDGENASLAGAKFTLTREDGKVYESVSTADGDVKFEGLDAGTYTLVEIEAPAGYSLNNKEYEVVISADYENERITKLTITFDGEEAGIVIPNTRLSALPETGGIGTMIFTVTGCAIMVLAAGLYFVSKRKSAR